MKSLSLLYIAGSLSLSSPLLSFAEEAGVVNNDVEVIEVRSLRQKLDQAGRLKDVIQKTEVLDALTIENKNALSLTAAINN
ncbi:hypothetical protein [Colwellia sp. RSH04]|uniref:hypothetical protein n=1 Tax=Colwellia sp. RSH04 TaxID=2305464 RepID=UPI000E56C83D|nr:hypothetical protein [Colwellia sp. RSH04]RHW77394.1 hypothetical protein D1094_00030 [Colwellia sp. RSH04]